MELLTVDEAAQRLKLSAVTIRRHIARGDLAAVRVGRRIRVSQDAIEHFQKPVAPTIGRPKQPKIEWKPLTEDDPLLSIIGIDKSDGPTDVSQNKNKYLAEAYDPKE